MRTTLSLGARIAVAVAFLAFGTFSAEARHRHAPAAPQSTCSFFCPQAQTPAQAREAAREARRQAALQAQQARESARRQAALAKQQAREARLNKFRGAYAAVNPTESFGSSAAADSAGRTESVVTGGRPAGCPHAFCGCQASLEVFGKIIPALNLAYNWVVSFNRASPAPGMVAARSGHVFVLRQFARRDRNGNEIWVAKDGNSGGHLTRIHEVSIRGYVIVDPHSPKSRMAMN